MAVRNGMKLIKLLWYSSRSMISTIRMTMLRSSYWGKFGNSHSMVVSNFKFPNNYGTYSSYYLYNIV
eukprot:scaffold1322_cov185-Amphora_coffeaeformis.AAC.5